MAPEGSTGELHRLGLWLSVFNKRRAAHCIRDILALHQGYIGYVTGMSHQSCSTVHRQPQSSTFSPAMCSSCNSHLLCVQAANVNTSVTDVMCAGVAGLAQIIF